MGWHFGAMSKLCGAHTAMDRATTGLVDSARLTARRRSVPYPFIANISVNYAMLWKNCDRGGRIVCIDRLCTCIREFRFSVTLLGKYHLRMIRSPWRSQEVPGAQRKRRWGATINPFVSYSVRTNVELQANARSYWY